MEEGENANKDIVKESEEYQGAIDENESYRKELNVLLARLESLKRSTTEFLESAVTAFESFKAAKIYLGSVYNTLEKVESSHKHKVRKLKRQINTANKEIAFLKNGQLLP